VDCWGDVVAIVSLVPCVGRVSGLVTVEMRVW
jgi:hypothetical protein